MKTVYKYPLPRGVNKILMPDEAELLSVNAQNNALYVWALVDTANPDVTVTLAVVVTGQVFPPNVKPGNYVGTVLVDSGTTVLHVFETARSRTLKGKHQ